MERGFRGLVRSKTRLKLKAISKTPWQASVGEMQKLPHSAEPDLLMCSCKLATSTIWPSVFMTAASHKLQVNLVIIDNLLHLFPLLTAAINDTQAILFKYLSNSIGPVSQYWIKLRNTLFVN